MAEAEAEAEGGRKGDGMGWDGEWAATVSIHTTTGREMEGDRGKRTCFTLPLQLKAFFRGRAERGFFAGQMGRTRLDGQSRSEEG